MAQKVMKKEVLKSNMASTRLTRRSNRKKPHCRSDQTIVRKIEQIDIKMQAAVEKGDFIAAMELAQEQERLLEYLMLSNNRA
ncbi:MAG: hypothetical protein ACUVUU_05250 [bacterium]